MFQSAFVLLDVLERVSRHVTDLLDIRRSNSGRSIGPQSVIMAIPDSAKAQFKAVVLE